MANAAAQIEEQTYFSPMKKQSSHQQPVSSVQATDHHAGKGSSEIRKLNFSKRHSQSFKSNQSSNHEASVKSKDEIMSREEEDEERKAPSHLASEYSKSV